MENASILNYQGNANLAAGSSGDNGIQELGVYDFSPVATSLQNVAKRANEVADLNYEQKIKDRDKIFGKLANLELDIDKTLPEGRQRLQDKISEIEQLYIDNPDITSDREQYIKMQKALREFNELNAHAKTNYVTATSDILAASKIEDPDDRKKRMEHIKAQRDKLKENPYELYDPYAEDLTMDYSKMFPGNPEIETLTIGARQSSSNQTTNSTRTTKTGTVTNSSTSKNSASSAPVAAKKPVPPSNGFVTQKVIKTSDDFMDIVQEVTDVNKLLDYYRLNVVEGKSKSISNMYDQFRSGEMAKTPEERKRDFDRWNSKIEQANKYLPEAQKVKPLTYNAETGMPDQSITIDDFNRAALIGNSFNESEAKTVYNKARADQAKDLAEINKDKATAAATLMKAKTDAIYKAALGGAAKTKAGAYAAKLRAQIKGMDKEEDKDNLLDELYTRNLLNQPSLLKGMGGDKIMLTDIDADKSLPMFIMKGKTIEQLAPIGSTPIKNKAGAIIGYNGGHYEPVYMVNGKSLTAKDLSKAYDHFKSVSAPKLKLQWSGSMEDWIRESVKTGNLDFLIRGANGTTDRRLSLSAQRAISNQTTKKGQDGIFEPIPDDEAAVPDEETAQ